MHVGTEVWQPLLEMRRHTEQSMSANVNEPVADMSWQHLPIFHTNELQGAHVQFLVRDAVREPDLSGYQNLFSIR